MIKLFLKYKRIVKYLIAGGIGTAVNLSFLYFFTGVLDIWYLISAVLAFIISFFVSFFLQKFWTFKDGNKEMIYQQMKIYLLVALGNLALNTVLMYIMVDGFKLWYMLAQFIANGLIAIESYIVYRTFVFIKAASGDKIKLRVLIATGIYPPDIGGPATILEALAVSLSKLGFKIEVITYANSTEFNGSVQRISRVQNKVFRYFNYFWHLWLLSRRADILYVTDTYSVGYFAYLLKKITGKKYLIRLAGDSAWEIAAGSRGIKDYIVDFQNIKYDKYIEKLKIRRKKILKNADAVIAVSNFISNLAKIIGVEAEKITVIYNAVDFFPSPPIRRSPSRPTLVYSGRLVAWKGVTMLIRAIDVLKKTHPDIILEIVGDGPEESNLKKLVNDLELTEKVIFRGRVSEPETHKIFAQATIFTLNTLYEGLPHSVLNALRAGLPVITTPIGGNIEVIDNGKNGLLVPYDKLDEWVKAISRLLFDKDLQRKFSDQGLKTIDRFRWSEAVKKTSILIERLC
jgi:glycosyltransferase involved in cell wall biosynthesis/putative flippase GtrA